MAATEAARLAATDAAEVVATEAACVAEVSANEPRPAPVESEAGWKPWSSVVEVAPSDEDRTPNPSHSLYGVALTVVVAGAIVRPVVGVVVAVRIAGRRHQTPPSRRDYSHSRMHSGARARMHIGAWHSGARGRSGGRRRARVHARHADGRLQQHDERHGRGDERPSPRWRRRVAIARQTRPRRARWPKCEERRGSWRPPSCWAVQRAAERSRCPHK